MHTHRIWPGLARLICQMGFYHRYHRKTFTKLSHFVGVPLIVFSLMIPLQWVTLAINQVGHLNAMWASIIVLGLYYVYMEWRLALLTVAVLVLFALIVQQCFFNFPTRVGGAWFIGLFVGGWVFQLIGHAVEKKKPALLDNIGQIFIAPIFLAAEACFYFGLFPDLKEAVEEYADATHAQ